MPQYSVTHITVKRNPRKPRERAWLRRFWDGTNCDGDFSLNCKIKLADRLLLNEYNMKMVLVYPVYWKHGIDISKGASIKTYSEGVTRRLPRSTSLGRIFSIYHGSEWGSQSKRCTLPQWAWLATVPDVFSPGCPIKISYKTYRARHGAYLHRGNHRGWKERHRV